MQILIVVGDRETREALRRALQAGGCKVLEADRLGTALSSVEEADILVTDWSLNGETANALLDQWVEHDDRPALVIVGGMDSEGINDLYIRGAWHVFGKPLDIGVFLSVIQRYRYYTAMKQSVALLHKEVRRLRYALFSLIPIAIGISQVDLVGLLGGLF